jgi:hypothetical protein
VQLPLFTLWFGTERVVVSGLDVPTPAFGALGVTGTVPDFLPLVVAFRAFVLDEVFHVAAPTEEGDSQLTAV